MILWLKLLVILSAIMFLLWFILYIMPSETKIEEETEEDDSYKDITDGELNERLKIAQKRLAVENLKNIEKTIKKLDKLSK